MPELPPPFVSNPAELSAVVELLSTLVGQGKVRVKTSPAANVAFKVDESVLSAVAKERGVSVSSLRTTIDEISLLASIALRGEAESFFEGVTEEVEGPPETKEVTKAALVEKLKLVQSRLVSDRIAEKYYSARVSKHDSLLGLHWEIVARRYDRDEGEKANRPAAVLRFDFGTRPYFNVFPWYGSDEFFQPRRSLVTECDEDEIDELIETLRVLKTKLGEELSKRGK